METKERTFLDPLNEAQDYMRECKDELATIVRALHKTGNDKLADNLNDIALDLNASITLVSEGRDRALNVYVAGTEEATVNMVKAAIGIAGR